MPQFFIKSSHINGNKITIEGEDFRHLRLVRRASAGDEIKIRSDNGSLYNARIIEINPKNLTVEIFQKLDEKQIPFHITLYAGIIKGHLFEFIIQKATEIGISRIVPVITERTIPAGKSDKKERWEKIIENASKQCIRNDIPVLEDAMYFKDVIVSDRSDVKLIAHPVERGINTDRYLNNKKQDTISILIGPEGGFSIKELELAEQNSWISISFGYTTLKAETACIVIPAIIIHELEIARENRTHI